MSRVGTSMFIDYKDISEKQLPYYIKLDTVIKLQTITNRKQDIHIDYSDSSIYLYEAEELTSKGSINIVQYGIRGNIVRKINVILPNLTINCTMREFAVNKKYIAFLCWKYLFVYQRNNEHILKDPKIINLNKTHNHVRLYNDSIIVFHCGYASTNIDLLSCTYFTIIDARDGNILYEKNLNDPFGVQFTLFQPRSVIDFSNGYLILAHIAKYNISIYNNKLERLYLLQRVPPNWLAISDTTFMKMTVPKVGDSYNVKSLIDSLRPFINKMSLIERASFLDDSTIIVSWSNQNDKYYDLWRKSKDKWGLIACDLQDVIPKKTDIFSKKKIIPLDEYYYCKESHLFSVQPIPISMYNNKTYLEIYEETEKYFLDHNITYSLIVYSLVK